MKDEAFEELSDKVRKGESVSFLQAIAVIEYQERLKQQRATSFVGRLKRWLNGP